MCGWLLCVPYWGLGLQPRHVPWLGIKLMTLWFPGRHSIPWATPARALYTYADFTILNVCILNIDFIEQFVHLIDNLYNHRHMACGPSFQFLSMLPPHWARDGRRRLSWSASHEGELVDRAKRGNEPIPCFYGEINKIYYMVLELGHLPSVNAEGA